MPLVKTNKAEIVATALDTFREKGYYNTAMSDLAAACGLQKGSFYHYFNSKEAIMEAVLGLVKEQLLSEVFVIADENLPAKERMSKMLKKLGEILWTKKGGCIIGNTILETATHQASFSTIIKEIVDNWILALEKILKTNYPSGSTAHRMAQQIIMEFEGALMFSKLYANDQALKEVFLKTIAKIK